MWHTLYGRPQKILHRGKSLRISGTEGPECTDGVGPSEGHHSPVQYVDVGVMVSFVFLKFYCRKQCLYALLR